MLLSAYPLQQEMHTDSLWSRFSPLENDHSWSNDAETFYDKKLKVDYLGCLQ